jgi:integrase
MIPALQRTELYKVLNDPNNLAYVHMKDAKLERDIWDIRQDLPTLAEEAQILGRRTISFKAISLPWLKELTKLSVLVAVGNRRWSLGHLSCILSATNDFSKWLVEQGYVTPSLLTLQVVQQWAQDKPTNQLGGLAGLLYVLRQLGCIQFQLSGLEQHRTRQSKPRIIPEEVKYALDIALEQLDKPIYLAFKLHASLATRSSEISKIPIDCLRWREGVPRIRLCTGKQDNSKQEQDLPEELVSLVQQQQVFVHQEFGESFPWLFPNWVSVEKGFQCRASWSPIFKYREEQLKAVGGKLNNLLKRLIENNDIRTHDGSLAHVTTHMYRRTYATVADRMGKRPDQIQHGLRHANPDMQDSYVYVLPQEQEKHIKRVLVDKDGRHTVYPTDHDSEFLRKEWGVRQVELGLCTRPSIIKDCEFEYVCLGCEHIRFTHEHLSRLLQVRQTNQILLERCLEAGQSDSRRANSARQFISTLNTIIGGLQAEGN